MLILMPATTLTDEKNTFRHCNEPRLLQQTYTDTSQNDRAIGNIIITAFHSPPAPGDGREFNVHRRLVKNVKKNADQHYKKKKRHLDLNLS